MADTTQHVAASDDILYFANNDGNLFDSSEDPSGKNTPQFRHNKTNPYRFGGPRPTSSGPSGRVNTTPRAHTIP